jgi:hypothetical protein
MQNVINYIKGILGVTDGLPSSKRIVSVLFSVLIGIAFVGNLGWDLTIDDNVLDAVMFVVIAGLGLTGIEKFANKSADKLKDK